MASQRNVQRTNWLFATNIFILRAFLLLSCLNIVSCLAIGSLVIPCTDEFGRDQGCLPAFVNAASDVDVLATNTCGQRGPVNYCRLDPRTGGLDTCDVYCDANDADTDPPHMAHPAKYLTDLHLHDDKTWWQSETLLELNRQGIENVNLTISLGKSFEITNIWLTFYSIRPESFAIYKRTTHDGPWIPYQYYSGSCYSTYGKESDGIVTREDETEALCTSEFSDLIPLTGGKVAFSTLEGRPSVYNYDNSDLLQEWVTVTDILVMLTRLNTFGNEVFGDDDVLRSYYYAISDIVIGGRCKCNGHASECVASSGLDSSQRLVCQCQHGTTGPDCGECLPMFNDRPWARSIGNDANECIACNCNGKSSKCFFDQELYDRTGHGGHCSECRENTAGVNCERCKDNYYRPSPSEQCRPRVSADAEPTSESPGSTCISKPRRYDITDKGMGCYFRGWADVQGQGASNDYCRVVGLSSGGQLYFSCALAGTAGESEYNFNSPNASEVWFDVGYTDTWYMKDEDNDDKDDYCRCVGSPPDTFVSCMKSGETGFIGVDDFRPSNAIPNCRHTEVNPFLGPP